MHKINFIKMIASGNDFVIINHLPFSRFSRLANLAKTICERKYGVGADGLLMLEKSKIADVKMRIFNPDGTEAEMCGNGARCVAYKLKTQNSKLKTLDIETKAGIIESEVKYDNIRIKLTEPKDIKLDIPIRINNRALRVNFINTGVPHVVAFVEDLDKIDVKSLARAIRFHKKFAPAGTNVNFVESLNNNSIKIRTYERGVEDETLACGTGAVASALLSAIHYPLFLRQAQDTSPKDTERPFDSFHSLRVVPSNVEGRSRSSAIRYFNVNTKGGEALKVYFDKVNDGFQNVWLEGKAKIVYRGEILDYIRR